jgi:hypothetical protein
VWTRRFTTIFFFFYVLLTVHHVVILGEWPPWRTILFYVSIFIFNSLHVPSTSCSSSGEMNCVNTNSGNCHSVSVAMSCAGRKWTPTCTRLGHRHRVIVTRDCVDTICLSWWWARYARNMQRVKNKNKYIEKNCASRWSFTKNRSLPCLETRENLKQPDKSQLPIHVQFLYVPI